MHFFRRTGSWPIATTPKLEDQEIFTQGSLPLAFDGPTPNCKAAVPVPLAGAPTGYYQPGQLNPVFFKEVVTPPPIDFQNGLGQVLAGYLIN